MKQVWRIITAFLILAVVLTAAVPAAFAVKTQQVEDFTAEKTDSGVIISLPAGFADEGYWKLFWKNETTGDVQSDVFSVETPAYEITAEDGAEYSFQLFYAKKRGMLPVSWKEEAVKQQGPAIWKVLWMDVQTIAFPDAGIVNEMTEEDHRISEEAAKDFEALIEEYTSGVVDIQITRMTLEEPVTTMAYYIENGYCVEQPDVNLKHYAMRKYDSAFVFGRMDHILTKYNGFMCPTESSREEPGYSFIRLAGEECLPTDEALIKYVCVHEFLHQLCSFYATYQLEIPDPDRPENYGYEPTPGGILEPQFFREALTMTAVNEAGQYVGVPPEAWEYKPTSATAKRDLRELQQQEAPAEKRWQKTEPAETPEPAESPYEPAAFGTLNETTSRYENTVMGLGCVLKDWLFLTAEEFHGTRTVSSIISPEETAADFSDVVLTRYAESYDMPCNVSMGILYPTEAFLAQYDETAYLTRQKELLEQGAPEAGLEDFSCEIIPCRIGGRELSGIKSNYLIGGVRIYQLEVDWLDGDHMNDVFVTSYMLDRCDEILENFYFPDRKQ